VARILIAEDDDMDRALLGTILEGTGHEIYYASDGKQALAYYSEKGIDVVVTDIHMPHGDGLTFITSLAALFPSAPVIAVSGKGKDLLKEAITRGARAALSKPVDPDVLLAAIADAIPDG
jgi:CheY-like chemotaxis protein